MKTIKIYSDSPSGRQLDEIARCLDAGELMIYPTDTLYAIGCDAMNVKAIEKICAIKGINPEKTNLSIICSDISMASEYARIENNGFRLLKQYTPGAFTFLFRAASTLPKAFKGRKIVGIRIPACRTDIEIVSRLGRPILTTSIEFDDEDYAVSPGLMAEKYEHQVDFIIEGEDGGTEPSTIVDCIDDNPTVIRQGKGEFDI